MRLNKHLPYAAVWSCFLLCTVICTSSIFAQDNGQPENESINTEETAEEQIQITDKNAFEMLFDKNPQVSREAEVYLLINTPEQLLPEIFLRIKSEKDPLLQEKILDIAGKYPFQKSRRYWDDLMRTDASADFQISIIKKYSGFGGREIVPLLSDKLESPYFSVREAACVELEKIRNDRTFSKVFNMALSDNPVKRLYASQALYYLYDQRFTTIVGDMMKDGNKSVRLYALRIIRRHNLDDLSYLVKSAAQSDENYEVMAEAMRVMVAMKNNSALYIFTKNLSNDMAEVRGAAAAGILYFSYTNGVYSAARQLEVETDDAVKDILIDIHLKLKNGGGFKGLKHVIEADKNIYLRVKAVYAAGVIGGYGADTLLMSALEDRDFRIRAEAAAGLAGSKNKQAVQILLKTASDDSTEYVKTAAVYALWKMRNREILAGLNEILENEKSTLMKKIISECIEKTN